MECELIYERVKKLETKADLVKLLNDVILCKKGESEAVISVDDLETYEQCKLKSDKYKRVRLTTKSGKHKIVYAPIGRLKLIQTTMNTTISCFRKAYYEQEKKNSVIESAKVHINKNYVYMVDVKNVFRNITPKQIRERLTQEPYGMTNEVASACASMSCAGIEYQTKFGLKYKYVLPEGAPLSIIMAEVVCDDLDTSLKKLAEKFTADYSRYYNRLMFSCNDKIFEEDGEFVVELKNIFRDKRFMMDESTAKLQRKNARQKVNGLVMSEDRVNVKREFIRDVKSILHYLDKYGIEKTNERFDKKCRNINEWKRIVKGKLGYMKSVRGESDELYEKLRMKFAALFERLEKSENKTNEL